MKRFIQTGLFLALKETRNSRSEEWEWEQMYDEFGDVILRETRNSRSEEWEQMFDEFGDVIMKNAR
jgi:hypothetical protein